MPRKALVILFSTMMPLAAETIHRRMSSHYSPAVQAVQAVDSRAVPGPVFSGVRTDPVLIALASPEPETWLLLLGGGIGMALLKRGRKAA
jgi:hypothetical protein